MNNTNNRTVLISGYDMTKFIVNIPSITQEKSDYGQLAISESITLTGDNSTGIWYVDNMYSFFFSKDVSTMDIKIYNRDILEYDGTINTINTNRQTAEITCKTDLYKAMNTRAYYISENDTPAQICKDILEYYGYTCDSASFQKSIDVHAYYGVYCIVQYAYGLESSITLLDLLQSLADIGIARLYIVNGVFYYEAYDYADVPDVSIYIEDKHIATDVETSNYENNRIDKYSITYYNGANDETVTGGTGSETSSTKNLDYGINNPIRITSLASAVYIGERYLELSRKNKNSVSIGIFKEIASPLSLKSTIAITNQNMGWIDRQIEILSIDNSNTLYTAITGVTT